MGLKAILDSLDNVPAELHDHYKEVDGKFVLDLDDDVKTHPSVAALSNAYRQEQTKRRDLATKLEAATTRLEGLPDDFDADAYEALKEQADGKAPAKSDEQVAQVRKQLETKHVADLTKKDERIAVLEGQIKRTTVDDGLTSALVAANVAKQFLPAAKALLKESGVIKLVEEDGRFNATVETDMGPMGLSEYVQKWATGDEGKEFVAKPTGGDAKGGDGKRFGENPFDPKTENKTKQQELIVANDAKARQMAEAAGIKPYW